MNKAVMRLVGLVGGIACMLGGILSLLGYFATSDRPGQSVVPPLLYAALGMYFLGKGLAMISLTDAANTKVKV